METVNISGLNKIDLLKALWENSKPAAYFEHMVKTPPEFNVKEAAQALDQNLNSHFEVDYLSGRLIKCDFRNDEVSPKSYDKQFGSGSFKRVVDKLRKEMNENK